jgi:hypothetical protein
MVRALTIIPLVHRTFESLVLADSSFSTLNVREDLRELRNP